MKYSIQGFGARKPISVGVEMAQSNDLGYATDIAKMAARKYVAEHQIFGVVRLADNRTMGMWMDQGLKEF